MLDRNSAPRPSCLAAAIFLGSLLSSWPLNGAEPGEAVDLAAFGTALSSEGSMGVEWENPREVREVRAVFGDAAKAPDPSALRLEWWGSVWPKNGSGGWMKLDDPWNGQWVAVPARAVPGAAPGVLTFTLPPLAKEEWKDGDGLAFPFRRTLKVRVTGPPESLPARIEALGPSRWREASFDFDLRFAADGERAGRLEVQDGILRAIESLPAPRAVNLSGAAWTARGIAGGSAGVRVRVLYTDSKDRASSDLTRVTVRLGAAADSTGFSFVPQDVLEEGAMRIPDLGALVAESARGLSIASDPGPGGRHWDATVRGRVAGRPEETLEMAMAGIPRLTPPRWVPLGVPSARQEVVIGPRGDWAFSAESLHTPGRDSRRCPFRGGKLETLIDTRAEPRFDGADREGVARRLEDDRLPLIHVEWRTGDIQYHQSLLATILLGDIGDDETRRGDETVVLLSRLEARNLTDSPQPAAVNLRYSHDAPLSLKEDGTVAIEAPIPAAAKDGAEGLAAIRGQVSADRPTGGGAAGWKMTGESGQGVSSILRFAATIEPRGNRVIYFKAPYVDLLEPREVERLHLIDYEVEAPRVLAYWKRRIEGGMAIDVPSPALNRFFAANLWHVLITTDRDPETGLFNQGVGTFSYKVFANETVMVARSMDARGYTREAERYIEPMLHFQGSEPLTGRYSTKEGVFHGAGAYTHGQYAMNHGFVLWGAAEHFLITRDRAYIDRVAPKLVSGCDFIVNERRSTFSAPGAPRSPVHGLSPASSLEDVVEFQYWFATNSYFHLGLKRAAEALRAIGHPDAPRLEREAEEYRRDIERAAREAATTAAAVRLRDGNWAPYVPSRVFQRRHLTEGWIREALYPALHLASGEVISPSDPLMTWMLDDLEDNIFFSAESGYGVKDVDSTWFESGAVTLQPCLLDTPTIYMARDEVPAALRSFWSTYALSIYPDVQCFAEWAERPGKAGGPVYKTSDESRFVLWLRQLLVWEDGDRLWLARGAPREWLEDGKEIRVERAATFFGPAGLRIRSEAAKGRITAAVDLPRRNPPREAWLRLRHPRGLRPVRVLGAGGKPLAADRVVGEDIRILYEDADPAGRVEVTAEYQP